MDLKYDILQFEDDSDYSDSIKALLEDYLDDLGFKLQLHVEVDGNQLSDLIKNDYWNLILMDYNLKSNTKGDELINRIRDNELYTEIIFYSEDSKFEDEIRSKLVDGIYFVRGRDKLVEKVMKIINLTLKKSQDVNNMRGLVIAETIDIEAKMEGLILTYFGLDEEKNNVFKKILDPAFDAISTKKKFDLINKICKERIVSLNKMSEGSPNNKLSDIRNLYEEFKKIEDEIINTRNILAHVKESKENKNTLISTSEKNKTVITVDDDWCRKTRKNILKHSNNLDTLIKHLNEK